MQQAVTNIHCSIKVSINISLHNNNMHWLPLINQVLQTPHDSFGKIDLLKFASMFEREVNILTKIFQGHYSEFRVEVFNQWWTNAKPVII